MQSFLLKRTLLLIALHCGPAAAHVCLLLCSSAVLRPQPSYFILPFRSHTPQACPLRIQLLPFWLQPFPPDSLVDLITCQPAPYWPVEPLTLQTPAAYLQQDSRRAFGAAPRPARARCIRGTHDETTSKFCDFISKLSHPCIRPGPVWCMHLPLLWCPLLAWEKSVLPFLSSFISSLVVDPL